MNDQKQWCVNFWSFIVYKYYLIIVAFGSSSTRLIFCEAKKV